MTDAGTIYPIKADVFVPKENYLFFRDLQIIVQFGIEIHMV
jgi:hypothetical protein